MSVVVLQDTISGEDAANVKGLGMASGDLLWVLSPQCSAPQPAGQIHISQ